MVEINRENLLFILKNEMYALDEKDLTFVTEIIFPQIECNLSDKGTFFISGDKDTMEHIQDNNSNFWLN